MCERIERAKEEAKEQGLLERDIAKLRKKMETLGAQIEEIDGDSTDWERALGQLASASGSLDVARAGWLKKT